MVASFELANRDNDLSTLGFMTKGLEVQAFFGPRSFSAEREGFETAKSAFLLRRLYTVVALFPLGKQYFANVYRLIHTLVAFGSRGQFCSRLDG